MVLGEVKIRTMSWKTYTRHANHLLLKSGIPQYEGEVMKLPLHRCTEICGGELENARPILVS